MNACEIENRKLKGESGEMLDHPSYSMHTCILRESFPDYAKTYLPEMERTWRDISIQWLWERPLHKTCLLINLWTGQIHCSPSSTPASRQLLLSLYLQTAAASCDFSRCSGFPLTDQTVQSDLNWAHNQLTY